MSFFSYFFIYLVLQHLCVDLYHDDYGYASLSYSVNAGIDGLNYGLKDIFHFLAMHYNQWGGRVLYFFLQIILLKNGLLAFQLFQSVILVLMFFVIYKLAEGKTKINGIKIVIATVALYN